jgi:hypothetical protein
MLPIWGMLLLKCFECCLKKLFLAGHKWLMAIILATQEAEIRKIMLEASLSK